MASYLEKFMSYEWCSPSSSSQKNNNLENIEHLTIKIIKGTNRVSNLITQTERRRSRIFLEGSLNSASSCWFCSAVSTWFCSAASSWFHLDWIRLRHFTLFSPGNKTQKYWNYWWQNMLLSEWQSALSVLIIIPFLRLLWKELLPCLA